MVSESEEIDLAPVQRLENGLNSEMLFHDVSLQFNCGGSGSGAGDASAGQQRRVGDPGRKTRELSGFGEEKMFGDEREQYFRTPLSEDGSEGDEDEEGDVEEEEDEDDDVDDDEGDGEVEGLVVVEEGHKNNSSGSVHSSSEKLCNENGNLQMHNSSFGSNRGLLVKDGNGFHSGNVIRGSSSEHHNQEGRVNAYESVVTVAQPDGYYSRFLQGGEGTSVVHKVVGAENGCGHGDRKKFSLSKESGSSLRDILSDPVTTDLMDDAMILPCGHSFGSGGVQQVLKMKACYTCSQPVSEDAVAPNLSLRSAVQAFQREEELQSLLAPKRRRERFEQNNCSSSDPFSMDRIDHLRGKGVQFPFAVTDRVIIKGNKRTPLRFVGREAVVTTQCLNGWYVVKTLDNAESVKLQYRSLAKAPGTPSNINSSKNKEERGETQPFHSCFLK